MADIKTSIYSVVISNIIPGNTIILDSIPLVIQANPVNKVISFLHDYLLEINSENIIESINSCISEFSVILNSVSLYTYTTLNSNNTKDLGYKAQLSRLLDIVEFIKKIIINLSFTDACNIKIISNLFLWLIESTLLIISIIEFIEGLNSLCDTCINRKICMFSNMMSLLINSITKLQNSLSPLMLIMQTIINPIYTTNKFFTPIKNTNPSYCCTPNKWR